MVSSRNRKHVSRSMMIKAKNIIMKERIWINRAMNETTFQTHCEATGHFPPVCRYRSVDDCPVHTCGPHGTCVDGYSERLLSSLKAHSTSTSMMMNEFTDSRRTLCSTREMSGMECGHPGNFLVDCIGVAQWSSALEEVGKL